MDNRLKPDVPITGDLVADEPVTVWRPCSSWTTSEAVRPGRHRGGPVVHRRAGRVVGIVGPNGAGKTSLFGLISGDLAPGAGEVRSTGAR